MNKVVHFEIPANDTERANKFYSNVFGWQITNVPEMNYTTVNTVATNEKGAPTEVGGINGGLMKRQTPNETPVIVIDVPSIDAHLKKVEAAGGKTALPKQSVGEMGFYARFTDPEGNVIGLWETTPKK